MVKRKDTVRSQQLRIARTRALARLRTEHDKEFQELYNEELAALGLPPRDRVMPYQPRSQWARERYKDEGNPA